MWEDPSEFDVEVKEGLTINEEVDLVLSWIQSVGVRETNFQQVATSE